MIKIEYLADYPEHVKTVAKWIYNQWTDKNKRSLFDVTKSLKNKCYKNKIPLTIIALDNQKCVGTVTIYKNDLETRKDLEPWLGSLYVEENHREKGVGEKLINKTIEIIKQLGFKKIYLRTETKANYYSKQGWNFIFEAQDEKGIKTNVFEYITERF